MLANELFLFVSGDSHVVRLIERDPQVAVVGIRGGTCMHVKERLKSYAAQKLANVASVSMIVGGNDLERKNKGLGEKTAMVDVQRDLESLVEFVANLMPKAKIITYDLIPRKSTGSIFNCRARAMSTISGPVNNGTCQQSYASNHVREIRKWDL